MSPEHQQPNSENANTELAFVQTALAAADKSERISRVIVGVLAVLTVFVFFWMHRFFFLVLLFAITMYLRQVINNNTRTILRAIANTRSR